MTRLTPVVRDAACGLPALDLWLDATAARRGPERVFVSHAHSDHIARHREAILSPATARFLKARLGGEPKLHCLDWDVPAEFVTRHTPWRIRLLPAGHIVGSAMALIEAANQRLLYTGDFKLHPGLLAEPCRPQPADILLMETTFGRPAYRFPPLPAVQRDVVMFCQETLASDRIPILLGYSLGKSQEILRGLAGAGLSIALHEQVWRMTRVHEELGHAFPPYTRLEGDPQPGSVLICPPMSPLATALRQADRARTAVLTGWAIDPRCRYQHRCDAAFPWSDHADFDELLELVRQVNPRLVLTTHGFAADFAWTLRDLGFNARTLHPAEQLTLPLHPPQPL